MRATIFTSESVTKAPRVYPARGGEDANEVVRQLPRRTCLDICLDCYNS